MLLLFMFSQTLACLASISAYGACRSFGCVGAIVLLLMLFESIVATVRVPTYGAHELLLCGIRFARMTLQVPCARDAQITKTACVSKVHMFWQMTD